MLILATGVYQPACLPVILFWACNITCHIVLLRDQIADIGDKYMQIIMNARRPADWHGIPLLCCAKCDYHPTLLPALGICICAIWYA